MAPRCLLPSQSGRLSPPQGEGRPGHLLPAALFPEHGRSRRGHGHQHGHSLKERNLALKQAEYLQSPCCSCRSLPRLLESWSSGFTRYLYDPTSHPKRPGRGQFRRLGARSSFDDEFRSFGSVAQGLHRRYRDVIEGGYRNTLKEFVRAGVTAYAVGCTEEGLRKELLLLGQGPPSTGVTPGDEVAASAPGRGARLSLVPKITADEVEDCVLWLVVIFVTLECVPEQIVPRWSTSLAVSADAQSQWKGFCKIIANAYYNQGMAWYSVRRLQMEQLAVVGKAEEAALVADRMRLVFTTLEVVDPRWGGLQDFPTL